MPLESSFYARSAPLVARELLGQVLELRRAGTVLAATITETEAYLGAGDAASHSHRGRTPRSSIMFGSPGVAYVYLIYGIYHCLNVVTEPEGVGSAVLIRAVEPLVIGGMAVPGWTRRSLGGPGRLCREFGVDLRMNGWDLTRSRLRVVEGSRVADGDVLVGPRVGIKRSADLPLRFRALRSPRS